MTPALAAEDLLDPMGEVWALQGCAGLRCWGTGVTQELLKIHTGLLGVSTVPDGHICSPLGLLLSPACLPVLLHCCYFISVKPNKTKHCSSFFLPPPLLVRLIHQSPLHFIFAISPGTACSSHASLSCHRNDTSNHEHIRIFKDWHNYRLDRYFPSPQLAA